MISQLKGPRPKPPWPCTQCDKPMARQGKRFGVAQAANSSMCSTCYRRARRSWRNRPKGSRHGGCKGPRLEFDEVAVDRLIAGTLTASPTTAELHAAIIRLTKAQRSSREIAIQLAITVRTVCRHRAAERARHESVNCQEGAAA